MGRGGRKGKKATPQPAGDRPPIHIQLPENGFCHPFHEMEEYFNEDPVSKQLDGREHPRTVVELRMCALSSRIREKPAWWEKVKDNATLEKWRDEALQQAHDEEHPEWSLTPAMVKYVLEELQGYAGLRDQETGIEVGPTERTWKSDNLIPGSLREKLLAAVVPLENVPDSEKDWHPGSDGFVLNLVHPNLYPIVYGRTMGKTPDSPTPILLPAPGKSQATQGFFGSLIRDNKFISKKYQWLPSDFFVDHTGKVTLTSPYINNVHPARHKELYSIIPEVLQHAVPMFERVLSDLTRTILPMRIASHTKVNGGTIADCIWEGDILYPNTLIELLEYNENPEKWLEKRCYKTPDSRVQYNGDLDVMKDRVLLKDRTIQVYVKIANIVLTPQRPEYPGGKYHVEGMKNEKIVSSFIYYYDSENISESRLAFRRATSEPKSHKKDDDQCMKVLYDMDGEAALVQDIGEVVAKTHRCIAFPNLYQHQVRPFHLEDRTKPGHRKILVFFLVDPTQKVTSTTDVAPQQREWVIDAMRRAGTHAASAKVPADILARISEESGRAMNRAEAEAFRKDLMNERSVSAMLNTKDYFGVIPKRPIRRPVFVD